MRQEGIYGWAAVNFLHGELLAQSEGAGTADSSANMTVGTLDLGGASTQISFFKADQVGGRRAAGGDGFPLLPFCTTGSFLFWWIGLDCRR